MTTPNADPLATAQRLTGALQDMSARLDTAVARGNTTRRIAWGLMVSVALDVAFSVVISLLAVQAHNASDSANAASMRAARASASNLALCRAGNVARAQQVGLWVHLDALATRSAKTTPKQRAADDKLIAYIKSVFRPRDCVTLGNKKWK